MFNLWENDMRKKKKKKKKISIIIFKEKFLKSNQVLFSQSFLLCRVFGDYMRKKPPY